MPRRSKGYSAHPHQDKKTGKWYGRLKIKRPDGSTKYYARQARNKTDARKVAGDLETKYVTGGVESLDAENITFSDLAERYQQSKLIDAVYDGDIKVAGMIAKRCAEGEVKTLKEYWGSVLIQKITHPAIEAYKIKMLQTPTVWRWKKGDRIEEKPRGTPRTIASVNHLLRRLRAILNFAKRRGWITTNPFNQGDPLISDAAEIPRNRAERPEELEELLAACTGSRSYLRPIILIMTDSALRLTEAKRLTRGEIDFEGKVARIRARNTKTNKPRIVPLSDRLIDELRIWCEKAESDATPILPQYDHKKAWKAVREEAGIESDLQLRDLRGWGTSRIAKALAAAQMPWQYGMKATGHTQEKTYRRYLKTDEETAQQIGEALKKIEKKVA